MSVFVDTNVLLRGVQPSHPMHEAAVRSVAAFLRDGESLVITPQIVAEFWNVVTRPVAQNGLGWSHQQARDEVLRVEGFFSVLIESTEVYGIERILTFNTQDFVRYPDVDVIRPA